MLDTQPQAQAAGAAVAIGDIVLVRARVVKIGPDGCQLKLAGRTPGLIQYFWSAFKDMEPSARAAS